MPRFATADGTELYFHEEGSGLPVLALPGLTRNTTDFDHVAPHLNCRLIRVDYRGRGQSDWAAPDTYTVPVEAADVLALMDHLDLPQAAVLGTSRGGMIAMFLAATAKDRLLGVALNDIGPDIAEDGLNLIRAYVGKRPAQKTYAEAAAARAAHLPGFAGVPMDRWLAEVAQHYAEGPDGLTLRYDPALAGTLGDGSAPAPDLWPLFDAMAGLPLAVIRGANSDLLTPDTLAEMQRRRPDAIVTTVPDRAHVPFLDEPESLDALHRWLGDMR
ncbi:alpha/beta fold hydrolase [Loktanella sp. SALINAS62]|uniref:alpha/beta fold hydrolase n=1 Tax=Loktanella sp. SALINAS62 TaxID=2706124 RepID=UPI001B8B67FB|nr:alpha/beta fold hydrolase [Loktanella sp. SALINAS62]MBS1303959.1 alpha/beta hydrolase [Loktanella sp. SALINAS62]